MEDGDGGEVEDGDGGEVEDGDGGASYHRHNRTQAEEGVT